MNDHYRHLLMAVSGDNDEIIQRAHLKNNIGLITTTETIMASIGNAELKMHDH